MNGLPDALLGPDAQVVIAGFPMGEVMGHHAPAPPGAYDIKDPIDDLPLRVFGWTASELWAGLGEKFYENFPFRIGQTTWITWHPKLLQGM